MNTLRAALQGLRKQKVYAFINIAGLALGLAVCTLMVLYVHDELSFDTFHRAADRTYRLVATRRATDVEEQSPYLMGPLGDALLHSDPHVQHAVIACDRRVMGRFTVGYGDRRFYEGDYLVAGPSFFDVLDFPVLVGDKKHLLDAPHSVVLTEETAHKYFGDDPPLGKLLFVERIGDARVTGVVRDPPPNSHLQFSMVFSLSTLVSEKGWREYIGAWDSDGFLTYIVLESDAARPDVQDHLRRVLGAHQAALPNELSVVAIQPLSEVHFGSDRISDDRNSNKGGWEYVLSFAVIAAVILIVACINYVNLATARGIARTRDIGMRKVVGASPAHIGAQLLMESIVLSLTALVVARIIVETVLPAFNTFTGKHLNPGDMTGLMLAVALATGVIAGWYPALVFSRVNALAVLRKRYTSGRKGRNIRQVLVGAQFTISIILVIAAIAIHNQLHFIRTRNLGFEKDQMLIVDINSRATRVACDAVKAELAALPGVVSVCASSRVPGDWKDIAGVDIRTRSGGSQHMSFLGIDQDFLSTFGITLSEGRNLTGGADTAAVLVNEAAVRAMGWNDPLHEEIDIPDQHYRARVAGVVRDFNVRSLHETIGPLVLGCQANPVQAIDYFTMRINTDDYASLLHAVEKVHRTFDHVTPLEYNFLDQRIDDFYRTDRRTMLIVTIASVIGVVIASLGLFGLVAFTTGHRSKEIGIRKVLGASAPGLLVLLSRDIAVPIMVATVFASPAALLLLSAWLQNFAYRVIPGVGTALLAGVLTLTVALATISVLALRAVRRNPVDVLRYE